MTPFQVVEKALEKLDKEYLNNWSLDNGEKFMIVYKRDTDTSLRKNWHIKFPIELIESFEEMLASIPSPDVRQPLERLKEEKEKIKKLN